MLLIQMEMVKYYYHYVMISSRLNHLCLIFLFQERHSSGMLFLIICFASYAFGLLFVVCELCQRTSNSFDEINDRIMTFNSYSFPHKIQKLLPIILIGTQKPFIAHFFGGISALRETFQKVATFESKNTMQSHHFYH